MINRDDITIAKFTELDAEDTLKVFEVTIPFAFGESREDAEDEVKDAMEHEISEKKKLIDASINNEMPEHIFLVAKYKDKVIGAIAYGPSGNAIRECTNNQLAHIGELGSLFILPDFHNIGVASKLISRMMEYLNKKGIKEFCFDSGYETAQKIWTKKFGKPYLIVKDYWGEGVDNMIWYRKVKDFIKE